MKKYFVVFILFFFIALLLYRKNIHKVEKLNVFDENYNQKLAHLVEEINKNTEQIKFLSYKAKIKLVKGISLKAKADFYFCKDKKVRIIIENIFGKQMDLGSNEEIFWFWSKQMNSKIYWSKHENINKTNLKTPLNPEWMMESMGLSLINLENSSFIKSEIYQGLEKIRTKHTNVITLIDIEEKIVKSRYLCNDENNIIASVEYKKYETIDGIKIPTILNISWYEEDIFMEWNVSGVEINNKINDLMWEIPKGENIDISKY